MLPDHYRLKKKSDFALLLKEGRFVNTDWLTLEVWQIDPGKFPKRGYSESDLKIGFVVGKKVHKNAVERNRIKRQMREVVRLLLKEDRLRSGFMAAFIAKKTIVGSAYQDIEREIMALLKKAKMLLQ